VGNAIYQDVFVTGLTHIAVGGAMTGTASSGLPLSLPYGLRFLLARDAKALSAALSIVYRTIAGFQIRKAGLCRRQAECGP
jgi:hypothetical protein